ncbi:MAG: hypothetical protein HY668_02075 [Chloroflexi bacterium]|nr:hypothetical protein [Chloroflexota bacterium]
MPPRHGRGRRSQLTRKARERHPTAATRPAVAAQAPAAEKAAPRAGAPAPSAPFILNYPYIRTELLRIGILTGVILLILLVLAMISPRF